MSYKKRYYHKSRRSIPHFDPMLLEQNPNAIKREITRLLSVATDPSDSAQKIGKFLLALRDRYDIIDTYKVSINLDREKLHISYTAYWGKYNYTFRTRKKTRVFHSQGERK